MTFFKAFIRAGLFFAALIMVSFSSRAESVSLRSGDTQWIAGMIFQNECQSQSDCLISWNEGEDFLSLGIGHFIWYPKDRPGPFRESFPEFVGHMKKSGALLSDWVEGIVKAWSPWKTRAEFLAAQGSPKMIQLRYYLEQTMNEQAIFMVRRFQNSLLRMIEILPAEEKDIFLKKFFALTRTRNGLYAMIDYANFKGDGLSPEERYRLHGWGLLQVMQEMNWPAGADSIEAEFVEAARKILRRRVDNAPSERSEERWIEGWVKRVETYSMATDSFGSAAQMPLILSDTMEPIEILSLADLAV